MRHAFLAALFFLISASAAGAQDSAPAPAGQESNRVQLVEDDGNGALRILIDGKDVATIDAEGLHIVGNIEFTGMLADVGSAEARASGAAAGDGD